jgi:hypothetical protein
MPTPVIRAGSFGMRKKMTYVISVATKKSQIAQKMRRIRKRISSSPRPRSSLFYTRGRAGRIRDVKTVSVKGRTRSR